MTVHKASKLMQLFYLKHKRLPNFGELTTLCGYRSKFASVRLVKRLIAAEIVTKDSGGKLLPKNLFFIPYVAQSDSGTRNNASGTHSTFDMHAFLQQFPQDSFCITVADDAMTGEGIFPGDLVVIDCDRPVTNGAIVAASINDTWLIRYYFKQQKAVVLDSANAVYLPLYPKKNVAIGGVVAHVIRTYR